MRSFWMVMAFSCSVLCATVSLAQPGDLPPAPGGPGGQRPGGAGQQPGAGQPGAAQPGGAVDPAFQAQVSYALGRTFASNLKELKDNGVPVDIQAVMAGLNDTLGGAQPKYSDEQLDAVMQRMQMLMQQQMMAKMKQDAAKNQAEEVAFLAKNGKVQGVQTTPTGLQYRVLQQGQGTASPTPNDVVECNYKGTLLNGTEFDASARHGGSAKFPVKRVIPGWTEALQKMHVGDKWQLFVPSNLAYGLHPPDGSIIEPGSLLVFEIELLGINPAPQGAGGFGQPQQ